MSNLVYLDHAAATPVDERVLAAMQPYFSQQFYNPSAIYLAAKEVARYIADARAVVARTLGVRPAEITFTAGGTEANNLAIHGVMTNFADAHMVVSAVEHDSVLESAKEYNHSIAPVQPDGRVDVDQLRALITDATVLVSVMYVNNEVGTVMPLSRIVRMLEKVRSARQAAGNSLPLYLHADAAQAPLFFDLHVKHLGVDLMTLNGGKIYGPKQSGLLYADANIGINARIVGGGQEFGRRSGTENVAGIVGLSLALQRAQAKHKNAHHAMTQLQQQFVQTLSNQVPNAIINGSLKYRTPNNVHITIPGTDNERLMMELDEKGIMCAVGSACSASSDEPSHVLKAMGLSDEDAQSSLRFTMGKSTTLDDIDYVVKTLKYLVA